MQRRGSCFCCRSVSLTRRLPLAMNCLHLIHCCVVAVVLAVRRVLCMLVCSTSPFMCSLIQRTILCCSRGGRPRRCSTSWSRRPASAIGLYAGGQGIRLMHAPPSARSHPWPRQGHSPICPVSLFPLFSFLLLHFYSFFGSKGLAAAAERIDHSVCNAGAFFPGLSFTTTQLSESLRWRVCRGYEPEEATAERRQR